MQVSDSYTEFVGSLTLKQSHCIVRNNWTHENLQQSIKMSNRGLNTSSTWPKIPHIHFLYFEQHQQISHVRLYFVEFIDCADGLAPILFVENKWLKLVEAGRQLWEGWFARPLLDIGAYPYITWRHTSERVFYSQWAPSLGKCYRNRYTSIGTES